MKNEVVIAEGSYDMYFRLVGKKLANYNSVVLKTLNITDPPPKLIDESFSEFHFELKNETFEICEGCKKFIELLAKNKLEVHDKGPKFPNRLDKTNDIIHTYMRMGLIKEADRDMNFKEINKKGDEVSYIRIIIERK